MSGNELSGGTDQSRTVAEDDVPAGTSYGDFMRTGDSHAAMAAAVFTPEGGLRVEEVPIPTPSQGEVLVRVAACGVCGSDRSFVLGKTRPVGVRFPVILGHEIAGTIASIGPGGDSGNGSDATCSADERADESVNWHVGDRVLVYPYIGCGMCRACIAGEVHLCLQQQIIGYHRPGGYAEFVSVPKGNLVRCPSGLDLAAAATLVDAFATPYQALVGVGLSPGENLLVIGFGGLSAATLLMQCLFGVGNIAIVTSHEETKSAALEYGANEVFVERSDNSRALSRSIRRWSGGGADVVLDTRGTAESVRFALDSVRPGGRVAVVGMADDVLSGISLAGYVRRGIRLQGSYGATKSDIERLVKWVAWGNKIMVGGRIPLEALETVLVGHRTTASKAAGRLVVVPNSKS